MKTIIACDPGSSGGIAWRSPMNNNHAQKMPETRREVIDLLKHEIGENRDGSAVAYIEKVAPYIPMAGASAMFEFGRSVERVGCILETLGVRLIEVPPQAWQKALNLGKSERVPVPKMPKGLSGLQKHEWKDANAAAIKSANTHNATAARDWKNKLKGEAQRRFPEIKVTLAICDSLLLLDYAIQRERDLQVISTHARDDANEPWRLV